MKVKGCIVQRSSVQLGRGGLTLRGEFANDLLDYHQDHNDDEGHNERCQDDETNDGTDDVTNTWIFVSSVGTRAELSGDRRWTSSWRHEGRIRFVHTTVGVTPAERNTPIYERAVVLHFAAAWVFSREIRRDNTEVVNTVLLAANVVVPAVFTRLARHVFRGRVRAKRVVFACV